MKQIFTILSDQIKNFSLIKRLSIFEITSKNRNNFLGSSWEILNLIIQISIYWFVFSNVMKRSDITLSDGREIPYFFWLLTGFVLWIFLYKSTNDGSSSLYTRIKIVSKANFPLSIVPSYVIFSQFYIHIVMLAITVILLNLSGYVITIHYLEVVYVLFSSYFLLLGISLITSTLSTIVRDIHMLLNAGLRMFIYISPVLWEIGKLPEPFSQIVKLNPFYYLIESYRAGLFGTEWYFINHWQYSLYFWALSLLIFYVGAKLHSRFQRKLIDFY